MWARCWLNRARGRGAQLQRRGTLNDAAPPRIVRCLDRDFPRPWFRWWVILGALAVGTCVPWPWLTLAGSVPLWLGYVACHRPGRARLQLFFAYAIGGLCTGAALAAVVWGARLGNGFARWALPLFILLATRLLFMWLEARYALIRPVRRLASDAREDDAPGASGFRAARVCRPAEAPFERRPGVPAISAWHGDWEASTPDGRLRFRYAVRGEIAMGGPTYGCVVFSSGIALNWVGPSFAVSDDGRYAALPVPSRGTWGLWLVDLRERILHELGEASSLWEIDGIEAGTIYGRNGPEGHSVPFTVAIDELVRGARPIFLVRRRGLWVRPDQCDEAVLAEFARARFRER
jgi:hypothetical protein